MSTISSGTTLTTAIQIFGDTTGNLTVTTGSANTVAMTIDNSQNVAFANSVTYNGTVIFDGGLTGNASGLTDINGSNVTSGTIATARLATGTANSSTYLRGDQTWAAIASSQWTSNSTAIYYNTGNVGIGTSNPGQTFEVKNATIYQIRAGDGATYYDFGRNNSTGYFNFYGSQTGYTGYIFSGVDGERMRIDTSGNVGIGTSSPNAKLDVLGGGLTSSSIAITNNDNATISANYSLVFQADRNNNIGGRSFDWKFGGKGYSDGTLQMYLTQAGNLAFNSGYGSVATAYGCRAWVNFNGSGTVSIRASGNVSSISDNGTGDYTVNFTNAMPDENYATLVSGNENNNQLNRVFNLPSTSTSPTTSAIRMSMVGGGSGSRIDAQFVYVAVFR